MVKQITNKMVKARLSRALKSAKPAETAAAAVADMNFERRFSRRAARATGWQHFSGTARAMSKFRHFRRMVGIRVRGSLQGIPNSIELGYPLNSLTLRMPLSENRFPLFSDMR